MLAVNVMSCFWVHFFRNSTLPAAFRATDVKSRLAQIDAKQSRIRMSMILLEPANTILQNSGEDWQVIHLINGDFGNLVARSSNRPITRI